MNIASPLQSNFETAKTEQHVQAFYSLHKNGAIVGNAGTPWDREAQSVQVANEYGIFDRAVFDIARAEHSRVISSTSPPSTGLTGPAGLECAGKIIRNLVQTPPLNKQGDFSRDKLCDDHLYIDDNNNRAIYFVDILTGEIEEQKSRRNMAFATQSGVIREAEYICEWLIEETNLLKDIPRENDASLLTDDVRSRMEQSNTIIAHRTL